MNKAEVAQLLTIASMIDNRTVAPETVEAWFEVLGDLDYGMAREAMAQFRRESTDYLMPAHIIERYKRVAGKRKSRIHYAAVAGLVPRDWPIENPLSDEIVKQADEWYAARRMPTTEIENAAYSAYREALTDDEYEALGKAVSDTPPWRMHPAALAILS